jgi:hypothetical protein
MLLQQTRVAISEQVAKAHVEALGCCIHSPEEFIVEHFVLLRA